MYTFDHCSLARLHLTVGAHEQTFATNDFSSQH